jgi:hypothetical protein
MSLLSQRNLAGGELAPALQARVDQVKYATGLKTMRGATIQKSGGARSRPGTIFNEEAAAHDVVHRLKDFRYSDSLNYTLELGDSMLRIMREDVFITKNWYSIVGATKASPCVVTINNFNVGGRTGTYFQAIGLQTDSKITIAGVSGMTELNGNTYIIKNLNTASIATGIITFELYTTGGVAVDSSAYGTFSFSWDGKATASGTITNILQSNPCVLGIPNHSFADGDYIVPSGILGMTELNDRTFKVANRTTNTLELQYIDGTDVDSTGFTAYVSGGEVIRKRSYAKSPWPRALPRSRETRAPRRPRKSGPR